MLIVCLEQFLRVPPPIPIASILPSISVGTGQGRSAKAGDRTRWRIEGRPCQVPPVCANLSTADRADRKTVRVMLMQAEASAKDCYRDSARRRARGHVRGGWSFTLAPPRSSFASAGELEESIRYREIPSRRPSMGGERSLPGGLSGRREGMIAEPSPGRRSWSGP